MSSKCKYHKVCKHYQTSGVTCNKEPGDHCGRFRKFEAIGVRVNVF